MNPQTIVTPTAEIQVEEEEEIGTDTTSPDLTASIQFEPLDRLGIKLRSWKDTRRRQRPRSGSSRRGRGRISTNTDSGGSFEASTEEDEEGRIEVGFERDVDPGKTEDGSSYGIATVRTGPADLTMEDERDPTRCPCCLLHRRRRGVRSEVDGRLGDDHVDNDKDDDNDDDNDQEQTPCATIREIKALDSDLLLSAEIGLTLLTRLNTLQATYDPLLISHSTLQTTYADLLRSTHRRAEAWQEERDRLEADLVRSGEREIGLKVEVRTLEARLKRSSIRAQKSLAGGNNGSDNNVSVSVDKSAEEWEEEVRSKEEVVKDLVGRNALLQHQLDLARLQVQQQQGQSRTNSPAPLGSPTMVTSGAAGAISEEHLERRKRAQRASLGYRSGSYSGPYTSTSSSSSINPASGLMSTSGLGRGTRHSSENALWTLNSHSNADVHVQGLGKDQGRLNADDRDSQDFGSVLDHGTVTGRKTGKLRPLSLSLSVSSRYTHAGPSSNASSGTHGDDDGKDREGPTGGHGRRISMTPSVRSTVSAQGLSQSQWKSPGLTGRESWVSSSTGIGMGAAGWDPDSIVREADGTPVWPQPLRQTGGQAGSAVPPTVMTNRPGESSVPGSGTRSGSGSGSETTSPRMTMRASSGSGAGSVGYSLNGVKRSMSVDRSRGGIRRASGNQTVASIAETTGQDETHERSTSNATAEMTSDPASSTTRQRKRMSRYFQAPAYRPPTSPLINEEFSFAASSEPDSMVEGDRTTDSERPAERPLRMVDSKSTQTDPDPEPEIAREETPRMKSDAQIKLTLAGLGIEEDTPNSSARTTPQLLGPYSPASPFNLGHQNARDIVDSRTGALLSLIEHVSKILMRLRQADVPNLTRRLKKHHLAGGDVGHLSRGEMKALTNEIGELRTHFRNIIEDERRSGGGKNSLHDSMITKKDFQLLLKLFKEIFGELIELRGIVNDVTVNPAAAIELRKRQEAMQAEEEEARGRGKTAKGAGGLGWIAAPITKLFAAPSSDPPTRRTSDKALLQPPAIRSSAKLMPSTSATTTQVSVEFASTGQIRRATAGLPVVNTDHFDELPVSPADTLTKIPGITRQGPAQPSSSKAPAIPLGDGSSRGPPPGNNRQSLYGIFAGGPQGVPPRMNHTIGGRPASGRHRRQLSTVVDAVIDDDGPDRGLDDYQPPLLERTLRPRGLSDSSIRTTFQHHGIEIPAGRDDQPPSTYYGSYWPATSVVKTLGRRIQALTGGTQPLPPSPMSSSAADDSSLSQDTTVVPSPDLSTKATLQVRSHEPRTIIKKRSATQLGLVSPASLTDGGGFLSMLSSSSTNEPPPISSKHSSPGIQRSESRTRRSRAHLQS